MANIFERLFNQPPALVEPLQKAIPFAISSGSDYAPDNAPRGDYSDDPSQQVRMRMEALWFAYEKSPWVRKCVKAIATTITKKPDIVPRNPLEQVDPAKLLRVQAFLNNIYANEQTPETFEAFLRKVVIGLLVFGHAACELRTTSGKTQLMANLKKALEDKLGSDELAKAFSFGPSVLPDYQQEVLDAAAMVPEDGIPAYLRMLPTQTVEVVSDVRGNVQQYVQWAQNGQKIIFQPQEIWHVVHPDAFDFSYGESQIETLALVAQLDGLIDQRQKNILSGDAAIDTLFTLADATPENIKRVSQEIVTKYRGANAPLRFLVAPEGLKAEDISKSKDGDFLKLKEWCRDEIAMVLGVPLSVLGVVDGTAGKGSGADSHLRNFVEGTCRPLAVHIEASFNRAILSRFEAEGIDYILKLQLEDADDLTDVINSNDIAVRSGQMTENEARKRLNLPPEDGGDVLWVDAKAPTLLPDIGKVPAPNPAQVPPQTEDKDELPGAKDEDIKKAETQIRSALRTLRKAV